MAASASAIRAGRAFVELFADDSKLVRGLKAAQAKFRSWGSSVQAVGNRVFAAASVMVAGFLAAAKVFSDAGDEVQKMAIRTGASAEYLSQMGFAAAQSGANIETFEKGLRKMQQSIFEAGEGGKTQADTLKALGLEYKDLASLSPEDQFAMIADKMSQLTSATDKTGIAMALFGRAGTQLIPLMEEGAAGIKALRDEADRLGLTISGSTANSAALLNDAFGRLYSSSKALVFNVGAALAPTLTKAATTIAFATGQVVAFIRENQGLVVGAALAVAGLAAFGAGAITLGFIISSIGTLLGALAGVLVAVKAAFLFLISPIGLVLAALTGIVALLASTTSLFDGVGKIIGAAFGDAKDEAVGAFGAIRDALASGDIATAAKVFWSFLKLEWQRGANAINEFWQGAVTGMATIFINGSAEIQKAWVKSIDFIKDAWSGLTSYLVTSLAPAVGKIEGWLTETLAKAFGASDEEAARAATDIEKKINAGAAAYKSNQDAAVNEREQARKKAIEDIEKAREGAQAERQKAYEKGLTEQQAELDRAKGDFDQMLAKARAAKAGGPGEIGGKKLPELNAGKEAAKSSVVGSFSQFALRGLAGGPVDRLVKNSTDQLKLSKDQLAALNEIKRNRSGFNWSE